MTDLQKIYQSLNRILHQNKIGCNLVSAYMEPIRAPRCYRLGVVLHDANALPRLFKLPDVLATAANVQLVLMSREKQIIWLDYQLEQSEWTLIRASDVLASGIGVAMDGKIVDFQPSDSAPHTIVAGTTGSGKSSLIRGIVSRIILKRMGDLYMIDPHGDFEQFDDEAILLTGDSHPLHTVYDIFKERRANKQTAGLTTIFLVADEIQSSIVIGDKSSGLVQENVAMLTELAKEGRKFGIRLVLGTQKPLKSDCPFLDQMGYRFTGKLRDSISSQAVTGMRIEEFNASKLTGYGDFGVVRGHEIVRFQAGLFEKGEEPWLTVK
ncbi:MAG: DUF87 domain-containing protein [Chryseobacterium sp.]|nr:MAG: DUF87 domain-containing protein [Chryseobacterium sp.]